MNVRRLATLVFGLTLAAGSGWAQTVDGGVKGGFNLASVSGEVDRDADKGNLSGFIVGVFFDVPVAPMFEFQPEFLYSRQGVKESFGSEEFKAKIDEFQIPLLARIGKRRIEGIGAYVLAGPTIGIISRAKGDPGDEDFKDELKSTDIGLTGGVGITVGHFLVEGRYTAGLTDLNKEESSEKNKSRVFSALAGFQW